ncbi:uncharacterized protein LOC110602471 [Manihot esculenta]|uniref:DUF3741 domain-containing protein n=1 Tax=Manihot esculenta TaxID=3983 RepID=A0A2C9UEU7_MANES|nr:uncharacterized protein LOC110602471 [Manihot esculenta]
MKDLSLFFFKNSVASKMRKGIRNICHGDGSTSTLNQNTSPNNNNFYTHTSGTSAATPPPPSLEEMILQLELEEEISRNAKLDHDLVAMRGGRMSCVSSSDILRSARNAALSQYPRFSLDGRDAMYRSSFRRSSPSPSSRVKSQLPPILAGETVVWCKPGVVAKLMGLEAIPVPVIRERNRKETLSSIIKRQNLRRKAQRHEMERRLSSADHIRMHICDHRGRGRGRMASCLNTTEPPIDGGGWPTRRFRCKNSNLMMP